jgi:hypothetical protein
MRCTISNCVIPTQRNLGAAAANMGDSGRPDHGRSDRTSRGLGMPGWSPTLVGYDQTQRPSATRSLPMETPTK